MLQTIKDMLTSKKFIALVIGTILVLAEKYAEVDTETILTTASLIGVYIGAQGIADHNKEKTKLEIREQQIQSAKENQRN